MVIILALIEDHDALASVLNSSQTGGWIQDDFEIVQISRVPTFACRVGVLLQNISSPEMVDSNLRICDQDRRYRCGGRSTYLFPIVPTDAREAALIESAVDWLKRHRGRHGESVGRSLR